MRKLIIIFFIAGFIRAQDTTFTAKDSLIVEDLKEQIKAFDNYQEQLKKEFEKTETIKAYLINRKTLIESKKNGKGK